MKILMIAENDPAGMGIAFCHAINRYTPHSCRLITKEIRYNFMFEKDLHLPWLDRSGWDEVEELLKTSDVYHFHMTSDENTEIGPFRPKDYMTGKHIIHHHHGHPDFRGNPESYRKKYRDKGRSHLLVSTPDLLRLLPEARWMPNMVPVDDPLYTPLDGKAEQPVIISHSPTKKDLKNTAEFLHAVGDLTGKQAAPIELRLIENKPHQECLRLKRESHILFDHIQGYFGVSSLEGLSQGLCVIAGLDDWNTECIKTFTGVDHLPWIIARSRDEIYKRIEELIVDKDVRNEFGTKSRTFMEHHWTERNVLKLLLDVYESL